MDDDKRLKLNVGGKYFVKTAKGDEFTGVFKGYAMLASETAMTLESGSSFTYIPVGKILYLNLLEEGKEGNEEKKKEDPGVNYG